MREAAAMRNFKSSTATWLGVKGTCYTVTQSMTSKKQNVLSAQTRFQNLRAIKSSEMVVEALKPPLEKWQRQNQLLKDFPLLSC